MISVNHALVVSQNVNHEYTISLVRLCHGYQLPLEKLLLMVEYGIIEPLNARSSHIKWQFSIDCIERIQTAINLENDLEINMAGTALVLELLDEIKLLRRKLELCRNF